MLRLVLIRHAKSSWDLPGQPDHERPLNGRGRRAAPVVGRWLAENGATPDHMLVSSARRAQETWDLLRAPLGEVPATELPDLYEAEPDTILRLLRAAPPIGTVALVGHNPGIGEAARRFLRRPPTTPDFLKYPTAATAVVAFDLDRWQGLGWGMGELLAFVTPRGLEAGSAG